MANRQRGYGLTAEVKEKISKKYDPKQEEDALNWMSEVMYDFTLFCFSATVIYVVLSGFE